MDWENIQHPLRQSQCYPHSQRGEEYYSITMQKMEWIIWNIQIKQNHNPTSSFHAFWKQSPGQACTKWEDPDALASLPRWAFGSSLGEKITCEWTYLGNLDHQQFRNHVFCHRENIDCLLISPHNAHLPPNQWESAVWTLSPFHPRAPSLELSISPFNSYPLAGWANLCTFVSGPFVLSSEHVQVVSCNFRGFLRLREPIEWYHRGIDAVDSENIPFCKCCREFRQRP